VCVCVCVCVCACECVCARARPSSLSISPPFTDDEQLQIQRLSVGGISLATKACPARLRDGARVDARMDREGEEEEGNGAGSQQ